MFIVGEDLLRALYRLFYLQFCNSSDQWKNTVQQRLLKGILKGTCWKVFMLQVKDCYFQFHKIYYYEICTVATSWGAASFGCFFYILYYFAQEWVLWGLQVLNKIDQAKFIYWMSFLSSNLMQEINTIQTPSAQIPKIFNRHEITQKTNRSLGINPLT